MLFAFFNGFILLRKGEAQYSPIYEVRCHVLSQSDEMVFSSMTGHMMELDFPDTYQFYCLCGDQVKIVEGGRSRVSFPSSCLQVREP